MLHRFAADSGLSRCRKVNRGFTFNPWLGHLGFDLDYVFAKSPDAANSRDLHIVPTGQRDHNILVYGSSATCAAEPAGS